MLRTTSPNISIITNFGCQTGCWYCVWKNHPLKKVNLETDWVKLKQFLVEHKNKGKVSVSGGGDCLYNYTQYKPWWDKLFVICEELDMKIDVHSRERFYNEDFWRKVNRCVISSDFPQDDEIYIKYLAKLLNIRITHVVTSSTTTEIIDHYLRIQKEIDCQFTIKKLVGFDDSGNYEMLKEKYPVIFFLDPGDYNIYYFPNNLIGDDFLMPPL